ncbi:hypothetical protein [Aliarcobacter thereius]|uniref:hypothetical protein n=1 Tax=Aliarcobacter thereius TaxID=544718 RepID=UPI00082623DD|nr:hypothetical protein [Aliarcobacter thereius]OCL90568.1 hypothetical protein AAX25_01666 [Aliarcobacter thereius]
MSEKELLLEILGEIREIKNDNKFIKSLIPDELSLSEISKEIGKPNNTIIKYLKANFEPDVDYKKIDGKIFVKQVAILRIRNHYAKD